MPRSCFGGKHTGRLSSFINDEGSDPAGDDDPGRLLEALREKFNVFQGTIEEYMEIFVPSMVSSLRGNSRKIFGRGMSNEEIVHALDAIVAGFPPERRPEFVNESDRIIPLVIAGQEMHVDGNQKNAGIAMLFPGRSKISTPVPQWQDICLMLQYKPSPSDDPISQIRSSGQVEEGCFIQLFQAAQNMLAANRSLFVFVIGLYGSMAKIFRFDHSAVVASPSFSYLARPNMLREFLWKFVNPAAGGTVVGSDPSITIPTSDDLQWATSILRDRELPVEVLGSSRWYTVEPPTRGVTPRQFLAFRPIDVHTALFSRATMVWEVLGRGEESGQTYVLKDAWRAVWSNVETRFYERIRRSLATGEELFGIADMICGTDLGGLEISRVMRNPATPSVKLEASEVDLRNATEKSSRHTRAAKRRHAERPSVMNANAPCHRTISSFGNLGRHPKDERTHMRLVFRPLGRPLEDFKDTKELAQVLRDAIIGHRQVYKAGILHRDVSIDNIMIANGQPYKGFIMDFDMSAFCTGIERGGKTGTWCFLAIPLLEDSRNVRQDVTHDLEAFFWVLTCMVIRYVDHDDPQGRAVWSWLFGDDIDDVTCALRKRAWLKKPLTISSNQPLTALLRDFASLCLDNLQNRDGRPLTHGAVLSAFDNALVKDGWPEEDKRNHMKRGRLDSSEEACDGSSKRRRLSGSFSQ